MRGVQAPRATPVRGWRNYRVAKSHSWLRAVVLSTLRVFDLRHATSCIIPRASRLRDQTIANPLEEPFVEILTPSTLPLPLCCASVFEWVRGTRVCVGACDCTYVKIESSFPLSLFLPTFRFGNSNIGGRRINLSLPLLSSLPFEEEDPGVRSERKKKPMKGGS